MIAVIFIVLLVLASLIGELFVKPWPPRRRVMLLVMPAGRRLRRRYYRRRR